MKYPNQIKLAIVIILAFAVGITIQFLPSKEPVSAVSPMAGDGLTYPSIEEMQEWCGAEVDGIWGPETDRLYRAKWARQYGDKMAALTFEVK